MRSNTYVVAVAAMAIGLTAAGCGSSSDSNTATATETVTVSPAETATTDATTSAEQPAPTTAANDADLQSLIPTPADTETTNGPDSVHENGVHMHFQVNGAPGATMDSYKTDLEAKGWSVTVQNVHDDGRGGGASYTATNRDAYGVFDGGGYGSTTDIDACVWPTKPSKTTCRN